MAPQERPFHPLADCFPMLDEYELKELADDIRAHGLREPITIDAEGAILDGRNRYLACKIAGVEPRFEVYAGIDPAAFVVSKNLMRRHLNESQRAMVAARIATMRQGERTDLRPKGERLSQADAAVLLSVGTRSVGRATAVVRRGMPELIAAVDAGRLNLARAAEIACQGAEEQRQVLAYPNRPPPPTRALPQGEQDQQLRSLRDARDERAVQDYYEMERIFVQAIVPIYRRVGWTFREIFKKEIARRLAAVGHERPRRGKVLSLSDSTEEPDDGQ